jgi:hypothetical protein
MEDNTLKHLINNVKPHHRFIRTLIEGGSTCLYPKHLLNTSVCFEKKFVKSDEHDWDHTDAEFYVF